MALRNGTLGAAMRLKALIQAPQEITRHPNSTKQSGNKPKLESSNPDPYNHPLIRKYVAAFPPAGDVRGRRGTRRALICMNANTASPNTTHKTCIEVFNPQIPDAHHRNITAKKEEWGEAHLEHIHKTDPLPTSSTRPNHTKCEATGSRIKTRPGNTRPADGEWRPSSPTPRTLPCEHLQRSPHPMRTNCGAIGKGIRTRPRDTRLAAGT